MNLSPENTYLIFGIILVLYASYKTRGIQGKIRYEVILEDKSVVTGFMGWSQQKVILPTGKKTMGWFYVDLKRCLHYRLHEGFPWFLFPTMMSMLCYRFDSDRPYNPDDMTNSWPSPNDRAMLDKRDDIQAYNEGNRRSLGSVKKGMLEQYLPYIVLLGFVILGYFIYDLKNSQNMLGAGMNAIEGMLGQLLKK